MGERPKRINLRRPEIIRIVEAEVVRHYRSELVDRIREAGGVLSRGPLTVKLARKFGFCYGVERAIDMAYAAPRYFAPGTRIFLLGEIIHNPEVNDQIRRMWIVQLPSKPSDAELAQLGPEDVVIIPAFGTEVETRQRLEERGCVLVDTTCGDVMSVWKRVRQYAREGFTSIIHGKAKHEETRSTVSQIKAERGHYLIVYDLEETDYVCRYIVEGGEKQEFLERFRGAYSEGFDPDQHLAFIGVANQTTMLRGETEEVQCRLREALIRRYGPEEAERRFRRFDTICGATQERQDALRELLQEPLDVLLVIGGYNSSNTTHLAELGERVLPTFFIKNAGKILSRERIRHWNIRECREVETVGWLPKKEPVVVGITAGASCPNNLIQETILRLYALFGIRPEELMEWEQVPEVPPPEEVV